MDILTLIERSAWSLHQQATGGLLIGLAISLAFGWVIRYKSNIFDIPAFGHPPIFKFADLSTDPLEAYTRALRENGGVIAVHRNGRLEYVVSDEYAEWVLKDHDNFSFETGITKMLNLQFTWYLHRGTFIKDMDGLVNQCISRHLNMFIERVGPAFENSSDDLVQHDSGSYFDPVPKIRNAVVDAMIMIILGERFLSDRNNEEVMEVAEGIAELTGMFQNESYFALTFPSVWRWVTWVKIIVLRVGLKFGTTLGVDIWKEITRLSTKELSSFKTEDMTVLSYLVKEGKLASRDGRLSIGSKLRIIGLLIAMIFASVHQTVTIMIWTLYELALRPDSQRLIREEISRVTADRSEKGSAQLYTLMSKDTVYTDSFIREGLRMKADVLNLVRMTTRKVQIGRYTIPKGQLVLPVTSLSNRSAEFNESPSDQFAGGRWVGKKAAVTTGPGYLAFGLGRWACPGRFLAIAEIKLLVVTLLSAAEIRIPPKTEIVFDKMNVTGNPPKGRLQLRRLLGNSEL